MKYLGICRDTRYSVNMVDLDAAIFQRVIAELKTKGIDVDCITESEMLTSDIDDGYNAVITMARNVHNLRRFKTLLPCFNSVEGILACSRKGDVARILSNEGIPQPPYTIGNKESTDATSFPLWVKNGEECTQEKADTTYVSNINELKATVASLLSRGVNNWLLQQHAEGDLVKFYGVQGTDFFQWCYPDTNHSKLGMEALNSETKGYAFDTSEMKAFADKAALALNVPIYGGDCIVDEQGHFYFIDFNDWPSFYCCRDEAARAIVERVTIHI